MRSVFEHNEFVFPYDQLKFPGQASDERILYVAREAKVMLYWRLAAVWVASLVVGATGLLVPLVIPVANMVAFWLALVSLSLGGAFFGVGSWWVVRLWRQSLFMLTNRRLTKFIYTTPWNRYNLSLGLDQVVDTGSYARGYTQALFGIGTFTARSSAGNRQEKYFYVENIHVPEDLANYVNKVLFVYNREVQKLDNFRPFIPFLKGETRKRFMQNYPHFWS